jgi:metallo-beta-lactamase family protein
MAMKLEFHGGAGTVTGSHHVLDLGNKRIAIDAGMFQGSRELDDLNYRGYGHDVSKLESLILTHAHIDHTGRLPNLAKSGFKGPIYSTFATADLCDLMLKDSARLQSDDAERDMKRSQERGDRQQFSHPLLYTEQDVFSVMKRFKPLEYEKQFDLGGAKLTMHDAGHILGSAILEFDINGKKLVMTGDLGAAGTPIIRDPVIVPEADWLVIESTYGNKEHDNKANRSEKLFQVVKETIDKGGNVVIPAFAVGRVQELLYELNPYFESGKLPPVEVYIDSPMSISASEIYKRHPECFDAETNKLLQGGDQPLDFKNLRYSRSSDESRRINELKEPHIVLSASGMCTGGRILYHLEHNVSRTDSTILFVGYMAEGSLGRQMMDGAKKVHIHGKEFDVRARMEKIDSYSAHADLPELVSWMKGFKRFPKTVFAVHGERDALTNLAQVIRKQFGADVSIPAYGDSFELK